MVFQTYAKEQYCLNPWVVEFKKLNSHWKYIFLGLSRTRIRQRGFFQLDLKKFCKKLKVWKNFLRPFWGLFENSEWLADIQKTFRIDKPCIFSFLKANNRSSCTQFIVSIIISYFLFKDELKDDEKDGASESSCEEETENLTNKETSKIKLNFI